MGCKLLSDLVDNYADALKGASAHRCEMWTDAKRLVIGLMQQADGSFSLVVGEPEHDRPEDTIERLHEAAFRVALARRG